jgi:integrase
MTSKNQLTDRAAQTAKCAPGQRVRFVADGGGLFLRVVETGAKSWVYRYGYTKAHPDPGEPRYKTHEHGLGPYPVVTLAAARAAALECRRQRYQGLDPIAERKRQRQVIAAIPTFAQAATAYIEAHRPKWKGEKYAVEWETTLGRLPFGGVRVDQVETQAILGAVNRLWSDKYKTQRAVLDRIRTVLDAAGAAGHRDPTVPNPARWSGHLEHLLKAKPKGAQKHHKAMRYQDLPAFMADLRARDGMDARALELAILAAGRTGEVIGANWSEIDLERRQWAIPAERMKAAEDHVVPLSGPALALLQALPRKGDVVFPGLNPSSLIDVMRRKMKRTDGVPHGFRSTFATWCQEQDVPRDLREMALAHAEGNKVVAAYSRSKLVELRRGLAERWARFCDGAPTAEVVQLKPGVTASG